MTAHEPVPLVALSLTWRDAPTSVRDHVSAPLDNTTASELARNGVRGLVEIHTCARAVWLLSAENGSWAGALLQAHLAGRMREAGHAGMPELRVGREALRWLLEVSLGLDSFVEGEADIGGQLLDGFQAGGLTGRLDPTLQLTWRILAELVGEARRTGVVRPGRGMGQLAVETLLREGVQPHQKVGVVGLGKIGGQVRASLGRAGFVPPTVYNRSARDGAEPLTALRESDCAAFVVCTAAPEPWFRPARPTVVVDLGRPAQAHAPALGLDALLVGHGLRLTDAQRERAHALASTSEAEWLARVRLRSAHTVLGKVRALRARYVRDELPGLMEPALAELAPPVRKRVLAAAEEAVKRYGRAVIETLKEEEG